MTFGTTKAKPWVEALPTEHGASFKGRTFSRFHLVGVGGAAPTVGEIWATSDHAVEAHAHNSDELFYVLSGAIEINGRRLEADDVVFIPRGSRYSARVVSDEGSRVLRVELPNLDARAESPEYDARIWQGALTEEGVPHLGADSAKE